MSKHVRSLVSMVGLVGCLGLLAAPTASHAKDRDSDRLTARLDPSAAAAVRTIVDEARRKMLPTEPLIATALEGAARGAGSDRIVAAVRSHAKILESAKSALSAGAAAAEIEAGASAIRAGVSSDSITRLRGAGRGSMVIPLVVMADMVARGVPPTEASRAVIAATRAGARDTDLLRWREQVAHDIRAGASPRDAARVRMQALMVAKEGQRTRPPSPRRPRLPGTAP